jgi:hypothetical protein
MIEKSEKEKRMNTSVNSKNKLEPNISNIDLDHNSKTHKTSYQTNEDHKDDGHVDIGGGCKRKHAVTANHAKDLRR